MEFLISGNQYEVRFDHPTAPHTLADLDIEKTQSHRWQRNHFLINELSKNATGWELIQEKQNGPGPG